MAACSMRLDAGGDGAEPGGAEIPALDEATAAELAGVDVPPAAARVIARLVVERDEAVAARKRALADLVNSQRRARENEQRALRGAVGDVVRSLIPVLDHADLAISHDEQQITIEQLMAGVRMVRDELIKALEGHVVSVINPAVGAEFDPNEHRAVMQEPTSAQPPNTIVRVLQVGYAVDEAVLRPAMVVVAAAPAGGAGAPTREAAAANDAGPVLDLDEPVDIEGLGGLEPERPGE